MKPKYIKPSLLVHKAIALHSAGDDIATSLDRAERALLREHEVDGSDPAGMAVLAECGIVKEPRWAKLEEWCLAHSYDEHIAMLSSVARKLEARRT